MKIHFIQTGGTIDKDYQSNEQNHGYNFLIANPAIESILAKANPKFEFVVIPLLKKDSLDLTEEDREIIFQECQKLGPVKIIITHGTDTIKETAQRLSSIKDSLIILTGAMKPEKFSSSDAMFNVGLAVGAANVLTTGVYIALDGRIYPWQEYQK